MIASFVIDFFGGKTYFQHFMLFCNYYTWGGGNKYCQLTLKLRQNRWITFNFFYLQTLKARLTTTQLLMCIGF